MSSYEAITHRRFLDFSKLKARKRFMRPSSPEGVVYGFIFRLIYCLVALFFSIVFTFAIVSAASAFTVYGISNYVLVPTAIVTFSVPVYLGELLRSRILDLTRESSDGSVIVELSTSGLAFDREKILGEWRNSKAEIDDIENRAELVRSNSISESAYFLSDVVSAFHIYGSRVWYLVFGKRALDLFIVVLALPLLLPVMTIVGLMIKVTEKGPVLISQTRVGKDGRKFKVYKFRTISMDADEILSKHLNENPNAKAEWERYRKISIDPRLTRVGKVIRSSGLDQLPMILNVVSGNMSMVGPAPMFVAEVAEYPGHAYYRLKPGLTGFWQIASRTSGSLTDRAKLDDLYEADVSLRTDISIIARTIRVVLYAARY